MCGREDGLERGWPEGEDSGVFLPRNDAALICIWEQGNAKDKTMSDMER